MMKDGRWTMLMMNAPTENIKTKKESYEKDESQSNNMKCIHNKHTNTFACMYT